MYQNQIQDIKGRLLKKFYEFEKRDPHISTKEDDSPVTEMDIYISDLIKDIFSKALPDYHFFSEEDQKSFEFPAIILDPIDGTREFAAGIPECAVSLAVMNSPEIDDPKNFGWIFNPLTGFEISTSDSWGRLPRLPPVPPNAKCLSGLVSRVEWSQGLFREDIFKEMFLTPRGSVAFKLGLLAAGSVDFVLCRRPKYIWDIAAGALIAVSRGLEGRSHRGPITELSQIRFQEAYVWASPSSFELLEEKTGGKHWKSVRP